MNTLHKAPLTVLIAMTALTSCGDEPDEAHYRTLADGILIEDLPELGGDYPAVLIEGLSQQLIDEVNCIEPGVLVEFEIATEPGRLYTENTIPLWLRPEAVDAAEAVAALEGDHLTITSGYRDVAMQYYDYLRGQRFGFLAGRPGSSRHQAGQAIDVEHHEFWRDKLIDYGWRWPLGERDRPHFQWHEGTETPDLRRESVRAFQRLWNRNHPNDLLEEDGVFGPQTEARLAQTPAEGFEFGGCDFDQDQHADTLIGGDDCDDERSDVHPGAEEICGDGIDQDCSGDDLPCPQDTPDTGLPDAEDTPAPPSDVEDTPQPTPTPDTETPDTPEPNDPTPDVEDPPVPALGQQQAPDDDCGCATPSTPAPSAPIWPTLAAIALFALHRRTQNPL